ncbi:MAG: hydroxyethylthiazole kinase [Candidatus Hydrothermia bacterium]
MNFGQELLKTLNEIRAKKPLVHNITNYVAANFQANVLLSVGASPVMAHAEDEVEDMVLLSNALVVNTGTPSKAQINSMVKAIKRANALRKPVILDPVGVGATKFRGEIIETILGEGKIDVLRGNAGEILAIFGKSGKTKGVDSEAASGEAVSVGKELSQRYNCIVVVTGAVDYVINQEEIFECHNGTPLLSSVTGSGCALSSLIGAFCAVSNNYAVASALALGFYGICAELAQESSRGPGSFMVNFLDVLSNSDSELVSKRLKIYKRG